MRSIQHRLHLKLLGLILSALGLTVIPVRSQLILPADGIAVLEVPAIDAKSLTGRDKILRSRYEKIAQFAEPCEVSASMSEYGVWEDEGTGQVIWRLFISAPGSTDINLGITELFIPEGCTLRVVSADGSYVAGPYTFKDNTTTRQLWTPVVPGDWVSIEAEMPVDVMSQFTLVIGRVNRGYSDVFRNGFLSIEKQGPCNNDVICSAGDNWRNEIRSVARYTIFGAFLCSGTLVMNARADFKAYFLTAAHCLSSSSEAATVVVYWNFQSPSCGSLSGGSLSQNQSGASLRATYASPDFTLLELNALPIPVFGVYYAGWDSTGNGASAAVCIHHPDGAEKAITFENDALQSTDYNSTILNAGGNHWRVIDWDSGTTGAGSSGAGLWNASSHRLIGQLHGGAAACGNDSSDWFGKFSASWVGGGTASSRLISWLDPDNTGLTGMDGSNPQGFVPIENYICTTNDGVVTIIYYTGLGGALIIPSTLNGMPVTSIGGSAFSHNTALTSITFSSSITNIGTNAFASCNNLFEVLFQGNAPSAGTNVFLNANNVTAYYLPGTFGWNATFGGRPARLKAGDFICSVDGGMVNIIDYTGSGGAVVIPSLLNNSPVSIGNSAFYSKTNLASVIISSGVTSIGQLSFSACTRLASIAIPNTVTNIGARAFESCSKLTDVAIPLSVSRIEERTFYACSSLIRITLPASVTNIGDSAFLLCTSLSHIILPQSVTCIEDYAFQDCTSLTRVVIPNKTVRIGNYAFYSCISLNTATIGRCVSSIGVGAFQNCLNLASVNFIGNSPVVDSGWANFGTAYYLSGTIGWKPTLGNRPTALWNPPLIQAAIADFDRDGIADLGVFNLASGAWYIRNLLGQPLAWNVGWGWSTAKPVPGDYDGDGKYDMAVFDTAGGYWYVKSLSGNVIAWKSSWGWNTAKPVLGDYNGDYKFDFAVYDTVGGYWYIKSVSGDLITWKDQWGWDTAKPVPGDYDGDGKWDQAVFDTVGGYWYIKTVSGNIIAWKVQWGWSTARPVPGDYDGDGVYDLAVFDMVGGYWYIKSLNGTVLAWKNQWGWSTAKPIPGDYNGDGKFDLAVYDTATGYWYIKSLDGTVIAWAVQWGWPGASVPALGD